MKEKKFTDKLLLKQEKRLQDLRVCDEVRDKLILYINSQGVKLSHISEKCNISKELLSYFKTGKGNMSMDKVRRLQEYLEGQVL